MGEGAIESPRCCWLARLTSPVPFLRSRADSSSKVKAVLEKEEGPGWWGGPFILVLTVWGLGAAVTTPCSPPGARLRGCGGQCPLCGLGGWWGRLPGPVLLLLSEWSFPASEPQPPHLATMVISGCLQDSRALGRREGPARPVAQLQGAVPRPLPGRPS